MSECVNASVSTPVSVCVCVCVYVSERARATSGAYTIADTTISATPKTMAKIISGAKLTINEGPAANAFQQHQRRVGPS